MIFCLFIYEEVDCHAKSLSLARWLSLKSLVFLFKLFIILYYCYNSLKSMLVLSVYGVFQVICTNDTTQTSQLSVSIIFIMARGAMVGVKLSKDCSRYFILLLS